MTAIYFNPIFDAGSDHSYDTQDYTRIDPYFGSQ
ncbi:MAG TPA: alpha-amylase family glycosyl hydrolase, partial [Candidatus Polarisedimenticolia bacterium]|nr:alpha-amylase family glycosyl hydrolase [Candidatus Polarisedimenticolia bacterium]